MLVPLVNALLLAHVPGYGGDCEFSCCHPPHPTRPDISQAVYLKGTAGIEIDLVDIQDYIDKGKEIEFSLVFKEEYDVWTYDVFVGCGGCASLRTPDNYHGWDEPNYTTNLLPKPETYQPGVLEAFTQTGYFPLLPKGQQRRFNASQLRDCDSHHFSIRVVTYDNSSHDLTYSIALGCEDLECEVFSFTELFLFPLYVRRNHGSHWNNADWTLGLVALVVGILYAGAIWFFFDRSWLALYEPVSILQPQRIYDALTEDKPGYYPHFGQLPCVSWKPSVRCLIYAIVVYALVVDMFESLVHVTFALDALGQGSQPYETRGVGLYFGVVIGFGKLFPLVLVALVWRFHRAVPEFVWRTYIFKCMCNKWTGLGRYSPMWAHGAWSLIEIIFLGGLGLIWLGAGYWIFPFGMLIAGGYRLGIWLVNPHGYKRGVQFRYPTVDRRWGPIGGVCTDETKRKLIDIYNSYYDKRAITKDGSTRSLMRSEITYDTALPLGNPMPMMDDDERDDYNTPPPGFAFANTGAASRVLSVGEIARLGRR